MIYTASIDNCKDSTYPMVSIDPRVKKSNNIGYYSALMPEINELNAWNNDTQLIYFYYIKYLKSLNIEKLLRDLENCIILSTEEFYKTSIRRVLADYLELKTSIKIPEIQVYKNNINELYKPNDIKDELKKLIYSAEGTKYE